MQFYLSLVRGGATWPATRSTQAALIQSDYDCHIIAAGRFIFALHAIEFALQCQAVGSLKIYMACRQAVYPMRAAGQARRRSAWNMRAGRVQIKILKRPK